MKKSFTFLVMILWALGAKASFLENWIRYPPSLGVISLLRQHFPAARENYQAFECFKITQDNRGFLGASSPIDGKPMNQEPAVAFQLWYLNCLGKLGNDEASVMQQLSKYDPDTKMYT